MIDTTDHDAGYRAFHAPRYAYVLRLLESIGVNANTRILDIGVSHLTCQIRDRFKVRVDTLGFGADSRGERGDHYEFDLNWSQDCAAWRSDLPKYDVIVMAEVLEHLRVAPLVSLGFVKSLLATDGRVIIQTPNAAAISKRIKLLFGHNPYEMIRNDPVNPGHYREYTVSELRAIASETGLKIERCETAYYFDARFIHDTRGRLVRRSPMGAVRNLVYRALPRPLRHGITIVLRPDSQPKRQTREDGGPW